MTYSRRPSRKYPTLVVFMIDQSGSMSDDIAGSPGTSKAKVAARSLNEAVSTLLGRCVKDGELRNYYYMSLIGYGPEQHARFLWTGDDGLPLIPATRVPSLSLVKDTPEWVAPICEGTGTPMVEAFTMVEKLVADWNQRYPDSFPPVVFNITDGEPTDGDPLDVVHRVMALGSSDGQVLVWNCHVGTAGKEGEALGGAPILFPSSLPEGERGGSKSSIAQKMFEMSSVIPDEIARNLSRKSSDIRLSSGCRGYAYNANAESLLQFIETGTQVEAVATEESTLPPS